MDRGDVVVEEEDGDFDEAQVEDVEDSVYPHRQIPAHDDFSPSFAGLCTLRRIWGDFAYLQIDAAVVHKLHLVVINDCGTPCSDL